MTSPPAVSIVIPFFNEAACAADVVAEVRGVCTALGGRVELLLVDDGSSDGTDRILLDAAMGHRECRVLQLSAHSGQAAALWYGLKAARAPVLITLDGDGQSDPAVLPAMLVRLAEADMVQGVRQSRHDSWLRRTMSATANRVRSRWLGDQCRDAGCAVRVFRREVVESLLPIRTLYSFVASCAVSAGFRVVEHPVPHRPRRGGRSSYGLGVMLWRPALDMVALWWLRRRRVPPVDVRELTSGSARTAARGGS